MNVQSIVSTFLKMTLVVFLLVLLAACNGDAPFAPETVTQSPSSTPEPSVTSMPSPTLTSTPTSTLSPTATSIPTPTTGPNWQSWYPLREPLEILTSDFATEAFQDLIIFNGYREWGPFANTRLPLSGLEKFFAFSPDGKRAGALTPPYIESPIFLRSDPSEKPVLIENGVSFEHPDVQGVELPPECYQLDPNTNKVWPCRNFQLSPDGRYLGFFFAGQGCGRGIMIQDMQTGVHTNHTPRLNGHNFILLENEKALIARGHCEGGEIALVDLNYHTERDLGDSGGLYWNFDRTAFAVETKGYQGVHSSIWGSTSRPISFS